MDYKKEKEMVLDHVLYEFTMYMECGIRMICDNLARRDIIIHNAYWECHQLHLRTLIEFFGGMNNSIKLNSIFISTPKFKTCKTKTGEYFSTISQAIDHLSSTRYTKDLTEKCIEAINGYWPIAIENITMFINELVSSKVTSSIAEELKNETIIDQIRRIKELLSMINIKLTSATPLDANPGHYSPE